MLKRFLTGLMLKFVLLACAPLAPIAPLISFALYAFPCCLS